MAPWISAEEYMIALMSVYGSKDAPRGFWLELRNTIITNGVVEIEPAFYALIHEGKCHGLLVTHVDDLLWTGTELMDEVMGKVQERFTFGSTEEGSFRFCGRKIESTEEYISVTSPETLSKVKPIHIEGGRQREPSSPGTESEQSQMRAVLGSIGWVLSSMLGSDAAQQVRITLYSLTNPRIPGDRGMGWKILAADSKLILWYSDCRSFIDYMSATTPGSITDKRMAIDMTALRQELWRAGGEEIGDPSSSPKMPIDGKDQLIWICTADMLSDQLTKSMRWDAIRSLCTTGCFPVTVTPATSRILHCIKEVQKASDDALQRGQHCLVHAFSVCRFAAGRGDSDGDATPGDGELPALACGEDAWDAGIHLWFWTSQFLGAASATNSPPASSAPSAPAASAPPAPAPAPAAVPPQRQRRAQNQRLLRQLNAELKDLQRQAKAALKVESPDADVSSFTGELLWLATDAVLQQDHFGDPQLLRATVAQEFHFVEVCGLVDDLSVPCDFSAQLLRYAVLSNAQQVLQGLQEAKRRLLAQARSEAVTAVLEQHFELLSAAVVAARPPFIAKETLLPEKIVKDSTFLESCGVADLITTCFGGRNRKCAEAFVKAKGAKGWEQIEKELLGGQKLQGTLTAQEIWPVMQKHNLCDKLPLLTTIYQIAFEDRAPWSIVKLPSGMPSSAFHEDDGFFEKKSCGIQDDIDCENGLLSAEIYPGIRNEKTKNELLRM
eukprot:s327_g1.t1